MLASIAIFQIRHNSCDLRFCRGALHSADVHGVTTGRLTEISAYDKSQYCLKYQNKSEIRNRTKIPENLPLLVAAFGDRYVDTYAAQVTYSAAVSQETPSGVCGE